MTALYKRILFACLFLCALPAKSFSQRYNFEQYDIEDGLIQSQITGIEQDEKRRLWITTLGGISCFNGRQFTNFTKVNGLSSNYALSIAAGEAGKIYLGTGKGLSRYDGRNFYNDKNDQNWIGKVASDKKGSIYYLAEKHLFKVTGNHRKRIRVSNDQNEIISAIRVDESGKLWAAVFMKGIYYLANGQWQALPSKGVLKNLWVTDLMPDRSAGDKVWLTTEKGAYTLQHGLASKILPVGMSRCNTIAQDDKGAIWIGTNNGAYYLTAAMTIHFNSKNGFTDNIVNKIFRDVENNIWLGTDGSGLFRYTSNSYVTFDETQGMDSRIVMAIASGPTPGSIWMGSYAGLYEYTAKQGLRKLLIPSDNEDARRINFLYTDKKKNIWIGTPGGGLWVNDGKEFKRADDPHTRIAYNSILEDQTGNIWLSTNIGVITYNPATKARRRISSQFGGSLLELGRDSVISGTQDGASLIVNQEKISPLKIRALGGSNILCMLKDGNNVFFGTADYGLVIWNRKTGKTKNLNSRSGLSADHIYSLLKDKHGTIWVGTGRGINRLNPGDYRLIRTNSEDSPLVECNQNAILEHDSNVWIGTTKGAIAFGLNPSAEKKVNPFIFLHSVNVTANADPPGKPDTLKFSYQEDQLKKVPALPYRYNQITINYTGIYFANPKALLYQYRLLGLDNKYSQPGGSSSVTFTSLPAGKYTFQVRAITRAGLKSLNTAMFSFEIEPPYYQTTAFRFVLLLLMVLIIVIAVYVILAMNERKRKLRLKIKLEEQFNIRKQTAEDFHDDLGNKLTRITVLSEVLSSMIDQDDTEKRNLLKKIGDNVDELYTGTRDILWSLHPKNDTLSLLLSRIKEFGIEMFNDTDVNFRYDVEILKDTRLSLDMSRNILMIFKESIHNVLKHANAKHVVYHAMLNNDMLLISLQDDGKGFDPEDGKNGHGINNMYVRAQRIKADLNIRSDAAGTSICLIVKYSTLAHFKNV